MLGMCVHLLSRYFHTVTHYSVLRKQNQPPFLIFLQKEFRASISHISPKLHRIRRSFVRRADAHYSLFFCQDLNFCTKKSLVVIITTCEKVEKPSKAVASVYVNQIPHIHSPSCMWITPVDKVVDNVENSELSTGILLINGLFTNAVPLYIPMHIFPPILFPCAFRHHFMSPFFR